MSEFEYLAVFMSIIFGISVTHILAGVIRSVYQGKANETRFVLTAFFFLVLVLNWWIGYLWSKQEVWRLDQFLVIVIWSVTHYVGAITLYPPQTAGIGTPLKYRPHWFLWAFVAVVLTDILQTAARGDLFANPIYLPVVLHWALVSLVAIYLDRSRVHRWIAWYLLLTLIAWSFGERLFLE
ncbi:MAG: hypothetical protein HKN15_11605 [Xanthomonadales bacterium]|nr:hypothetical protein [Xanthomonadales bacterium]